MLLISLEFFSSLEIKVILLTLHVAMQIGLYLHRLEFGVWHVVSEDSDHFRARLAVIHCLHDLNDLQQSTRSEMRIRPDDLHTRCESLKVEALRGAQWISLKEWNDRFDKIAPLRYNVLIQMFFVVVVSLVAIHTSHAEVLLHRLQTLDALRTLRNYKLMSHLESSSITSSIWSMRLSHDMDWKTSLAVDKTGNPANYDQSFLLIVRSWRIFTAPRLIDVGFVADTNFIEGRVSQHARRFQHIAKFY
jgi:hypothetical protein